MYTAVLWVYMVFLKVCFQMKLRNTVSKRKKENQRDVCLSLVTSRRGGHATVISVVSFCTWRFLNNANSHISNRCSVVDLCVDRLKHFIPPLEPQNVLVPELRAVQLKKNEKDNEVPQGRVVSTSRNSSCCLKIICLMI